MSPTLQEFSDQLASVAEQAGQSIVRVEGRHRLPATGIVWSDDLIVTANHVVQTDEIIIGLPDGQTLEASLVGRDPSTDLAILKTSHGLTPLATTSAKVGNIVLALARPAQNLQATLGVVSAVGLEPNPAGRQRKTRDEKQRGEQRSRHGRRMHMQHGHRSRMHVPSQLKLDQLIQTDVLMYPGFSGGALISADGSLLGMNTSAISHGASIALSHTLMESIAQSLTKHGKIRRGYLGVGLQSVEINAEQTGLLIVSIEAESPATQAGLLVGDIIVSFDDTDISELEDLLEMLSGDRVGNAIKTGIIRGGEPREIEVTVGERQ